MKKIIIPANLKKYSVIDAFNDLKCIDWRLYLNKVEPGDEVYIYISAPVKAVKYKCRVNSIKKHSDIDDKKYDKGLPQANKYMEIELVRTFDNELSRHVLMENGLNFIRSQRYMPEELSTYIESIE